MIEIREWVTPIVVGAYPNETIQSVAKRMQQHGIGSVIVHDKGQLPMGIFTERDLLTKVVVKGLDPAKVEVKEVMTSPIETVNINCPAFEVFKLFSDRDFRHLPVTLQDGRVVGVLSMRSKAFTQEICRMMQELQNINELKSRFLANVSHELKNPLSNISGSAALLMTNFKSMNQEEIFKFLEIIERQGNHLLKVINDLLDMTALEAGKMRIEPSYVDLNRLIDQSIRNTQIIASRKKINVSHDNSTPSYVVFADESRVIQVLDNLVSNAIKYTQEGGQVTISVTPEDANKDVVRVAIRDTGIGIAKEKLRMIFERFERAHDPTIGKVEGMGLGLTIVREIVGLHNGRIWVESEEKKGSTFYFTLPTSQEAQQQQLKQEEVFRQQ